MNGQPQAEKFFLDIYKANKLFVLERWEKWQELVRETLKADVDKVYPDGFIDFLVEQFDAEINSRVKILKKYERENRKADKKSV